MGTVLVMSSLLSQVYTTCSSRTSGTLVYSLSLHLLMYKILRGYWKLVKSGSQWKKYGVSTR